MTEHSELLPNLLDEDAFEVQMRGYSRRQVDEFVARSRSQTRDLEERLPRARHEREPPPPQRPRPPPAPGPAPPPAEIRAARAQIPQPPRRPPTAQSPRPPR